MAVSRSRVTYVAKGNRMRADAASMRGTAAAAITGQGVDTGISEREHRPDPAGSGNLGRLGVGGGPNENQPVTERLNSTACDQHFEPDTPAALRTNRPVADPEARETLRAAVVSYSDAGHEPILDSSVQRINILSKTMFGVCTQATVSHPDGGTHGVRA